MSAASYPPTSHAQANHQQQMSRVYRSLVDEAHDYTAAEIARLVALGRKAEEKAMACEKMGKRGRTKYFRRRRDFFNAKAVGLKMGAA